MSSVITRQEFLELCEEGPNGGHFADEFEGYLNDTYGTIEIAGVEFYAASILAECDPIAHGEAWSNWVDALADEHPEGEKCEPCDLWVADMDEHNEYDCDHLAREAHCGSCREWHETASRWCPDCGTLLDDMEGQGDD